MISKIDVRILQPIRLKDGRYLPVGRIVALPENIVYHLGDKVRPLLEELDREFGSDPLWLRWRENPKAVKQLAMNLAETAMRRRGELPVGYTTTATCERCGPVLLPAGNPTHVPACCWCLNRVAALPIPRPHEVRHAANS